jgi:hypothetical protein
MRLTFTNVGDLTIADLENEAGKDREPNGE